MKPENMTESDYEGQWDADTLARAEVIKADSSRLKRAQAWAEVKVAREKAEADAMAKVAAG